MRLNTDRIVSLSAMVVGIGSLILVTYQTQAAQSALRPTLLRDLLHAFEIAEVPRRWYVSVGAWYVSVGALERDKAVIEIIYASVYGERWRLRSDRMTPERL